MVLVLGAGAVSAGIPESLCCRCFCGADGPVFCISGPADSGDVEDMCRAACGDSADLKCLESPETTAGGGVGGGGGRCDIFPDCDGVPRQFNNRTAPTASPYGIAALLIALGGFGA